MTVTTEESTGRTNFNYTKYCQLQFHAQMWSFTPEFYEDENITGEVAKAAAVTELKEAIQDMAERQAPSAIYNSAFLVLSGVKDIDDSAELSEEAKIQSAEAMNLNTSLNAFSNSIPSEFGNANDKVYTSSFVESLSIPEKELAATDTVELQNVTIKIARLM